MALNIDWEALIDEAAVDKLANLMKTKLAEKRNQGFGRWWDEDITDDELFERLRMAVDAGKLVNAANFCAFLIARDSTYENGN